MSNREYKEADEASKEAQLVNSEVEEVADEKSVPLKDGDGYFFVAEIHIPGIGAAIGGWAGPFKTYESAAKLKSLVGRRLEHSLASGILDGSGVERRWNNEIVSGYFIESPQGTTSESKAEFNRGVKYALIGVAVGLALLTLGGILYGVLS